MADEKTNGGTAAEAPTGFIEYLGDGGPTGVSFMTSHTLRRTDSLFRRAGVKLTKDITWERDPYGPAIGQPGARLLVPVADLDPAAVDLLAKTPGFRVVNE